jgi:hypothetical protein
MIISRLARYLIFQTLFPVFIMQEHAPSLSFLPKALRPIVALLIFISCLQACASHDSLYVGEDEVGEVRREELMAAKEKLEEARKLRREGLIRPSESNVLVQELPKDALRRGRVRNAETQDEFLPAPRSDSDFGDGEADNSEMKLDEEQENKQVEILWALPETPVDAYILRYGYDKENLSEELRIAADEVEIIEVEEYGKVNRFLLRHLPPGQSVFVSLASERAGKVSKFSEVLVLQGDTP